MPLVFKTKPAGTEVVKPIQHGGDLSVIRKRYGLGNEPLLDFSVSINAMGLAGQAMEAAKQALCSIERYPITGCPRLTERLAEYHDVPIECVIVGAGTTELIRLLAESMREPLVEQDPTLSEGDAPTAHLIEPSYAEYRRCSALSRYQIRQWRTHIIGWTQDFFPRGESGLFWTGHPNNPTGRTWNIDELLGHVDDSPHLLTCVDEAYLPFLPDEADRSLIPEVPDRENLVVMRSMTKFWAMPGLRVGYAIASPDIVERMRHFQEPWTVSQPAEAAANAVLDQEEYRLKAVESIGAESLRVFSHLWEIPGVRPLWPNSERPEDTPGLPNFLTVSLVDTPWNSHTAHEAIAKRGVVLRECSNYRGLEMGAAITGPDLYFVANGHFRFALRSKVENDKLLKALNDVMRTRPAARS